MKTKILLSLFIILSSVRMWSSNVITYTASEKLNETTSSYSSGLHTNAFNVSISSHTFSNGVGIITFSGNVTSIQDRAFYGCSSLTSITIPESITSFGGSVFSSCLALTSIIWNATNCPSFSTNSMDYTVRAQITSFVIGANVTTIPDKLCASMKKLASVNIPSGVTNIGNSAFSDCENLATISIPLTVKSVGSSAFYNCTKLFSLTIPSSVTTIGSSAFNNIPNIVYSGSATGSPWGANMVNGYIEANLLYSDNTKAKIMGCSPLATGAIVIPSTVTQINPYAFRGCTGLTAVHISDLEKWCSINFSSNEANPLSYAHHLYLNGTEITDLTIPSTITTIYNYAFYGWHGLKTVTIPSSVTRIWTSAFQECIGLTTVTMPNTVTQIANSAFYGCSSLTSINIPNSVTSIGSSAFQGCTSLTSVDVPSTVKTIDTYAFMQVRNINYSGSASDSYGNNWGAMTRNGTVDGYLVYTNNTKTTLSGCSAAATDIVIPSTVTNIKSNAFYGCKKLTSVTIPSSVNTIALYAFQGCTGLTSVHIDDIASWCNISFESDDANPLYYAHHLYVGDNRVTDLVIPDGVTTICDRAFLGSSDFTSVTIPNSVTSIGSSAFAGSSVFSSIEIPSSVTSIGSSVFAGCSNLSSVTWNAIRCATPTGNSSSPFPAQITNFAFGDGVEIIPRKLCYSMENLSSVTIPRSVISIGYYAFAYCSGLGTIAIPKNVVSLGEGAFYATDLTSLSCSAVTPPSVADYYTFMISSTSSEYPDIPVFVPSGSVDAYQNADYWKNFTNIIGVENGDVNLDQKVNVTDAVEVIYNVVGNPSANFVKVWSDVNSDDQYTIADAMAVVNVILGEEIGTSSAKGPNRAEAAPDALTFVRADDNTLALAMDNTMAYSAFQFELTLPEGMTLENVTLNQNRCSNFSMMYRETGENKYTVAVYNFGNEPFATGTGNLLYMTTSGYGDSNEIEMTDIHFSTTRAVDVQFDALFLSDATGIESVNENEYENENIYDLSGRRLNDAQRGVNIINGKKIIIK